MRVLLGAAVVAAAVFVRAPAHAAAAPAAPLDLRGAVRYALEHDPTVLARRATLAQDEATYAKNHAAEFPSLAGTLQNQVSKQNGAYGGTFSQAGLTQTPVFSQNTAQIASSFTLYNGSASQIAAQSSLRTVEAARWDSRRAEQQLASDVATAWYNAVQQRDAVTLAVGDLQYQQELIAAARAQERVGRIAGVDVLRAQVNELRSEANLTSARAAALDAQESLAQRIGAPPDTPFALPKLLPEPPLPARPVDTLVAAAVATRADVTSARAQVAVARLAGAAIDTDLRPQIALNGALGHQETPTTQELVNVNGIPTRTGLVRSGPGFWLIGASETFTLPFIQYGARRASHAAARAQLASAEAALSSTLGAVEVDVRQSLRAAQTARANLTTAVEADKAGSESARIAQLQYRNGLISLTDATSAQRDALQAASDLVAAHVSYLDALVKLRVAVGTADPLAIVDPGAP